MSYQHYGLFSVEMIPNDEQKGSRKETAVY